MSPQEARLLAGQLDPRDHGTAAPQPASDIVERIRAAGRTRESYLAWCEYDEAADEIERLRSVLRAVRASTDPRWQAQLIDAALRSAA